MTRTRTVALAFGILLAGGFAIRRAHRPAPFAMATPTPSCRQRSQRPHRAHRPGPAGRPGQTAARPAFDRADRFSPKAQACACRELTPGGSRAPPSCASKSAGALAIVITQRPQERAGAEISRKPARWRSAWRPWCWASERAAAIQPHRRAAQDGHARPLRCWRRTGHDPGALPDRHEGCDVHPRSLGRDRTCATASAVSVRARTPWARSR